MLIWGLTALTLIVVYLFFAARITRKIHGLEDVFDFLEKQGYVINHGFSGMYQPGNIIQVTERVDGMEKQLAMPILVLSKKSCFPGREPLLNPFTLPQYSGTSFAGLKASANTVTYLLPDLVLDSKTVANYSLQLGAIHTAAFARLDLSRKLSEQCVDDLQNALVDGDQVEWFKVINEAVITDSLSFEIDWKSGTSVEARKNIKDMIFRNVLQMVPKNDEKSQAMDVNAGVQVETNKKMVIKAKGQTT